MSEGNDEYLRRYAHVLSEALVLVGTKRLRLVANALAYALAYVVSVVVSRLPQDVSLAGPGPKPKPNRVRNHSWPL